MAAISRIIDFIKQKILKREPQKLLTAATSTQGKIHEEIDWTAIKNYLNQEKYVKNLTISLNKLKPTTKKSLIQKIDTLIGGTVNSTHDDVCLLEGTVSGEFFISVRKRNVESNKIGQTIITENGYVDMAVKKIMRDDTYTSLDYKEYKIKDGYNDIFEYDEDNEKYDRAIKNSNVIFHEKACYAQEDELEKIEMYAQPTEDPKAIKDYLSGTKLKYINNDERNNIENVLKISPFLVLIELYNVDKNGKIVNMQSLKKIFKSKKECIVGYRPEMILIENIEKGVNDIKMFRLLPNEGVYVDNSSFKLNFEGKYSFKKVQLEEVENLVTEIPFKLSEHTKKILRNGFDVPVYIEKLFKMGMEQIKILGLNETKNQEE